MTFNAENLFDTKHDSGKNDYQFLPLKLKKKLHDIVPQCKKLQSFRQRKCLTFDWSEKKYRRKLDQIAKTIEHSGYFGPDIVVLTEVENKKVLNDLNQHLPQSSYVSEILIPSDDPRGINVAILSRFLLQTSPRIYSIPKSRGILEASFLIQNKTYVSQKIQLTVLGFHFSSQLGSSTQRHKGIQKLAEILATHLAENPQKLIIAAGDSNISSDDDTSLKALKQYITPLGSLSHEIGCKKCSGTYWYQGQWSFLDWIFFPHSIRNNPNSLARINIESIDTPKDWFSQQDTKGRPYRFNPASGFGVSDHFPIYAELTIN